MNKIKGLVKWVKEKVHTAWYNFRADREEPDEGDARHAITAEGVKTWICYVLSTVHGIVSSIMAQRYIKSLLKITDRISGASYREEAPLYTPGGVAAGLFAAIVFFLIYLLVVGGIFVVFIIIKFFTKRFEYARDVQQTSLMIMAFTCGVLSLVLWLEWIPFLK